MVPQYLLKAMSPWNGRVKAATQTELVRKRHIHIIITCIRGESGWHIFHNSWQPPPKQGQYIICQYTALAVSQLEPRRLRRG